MRWKEFFKSTFTSLCNAINATGISQIVERIRRVFYKNEGKPCGGCDPTDSSDPCNNLLNRQTSTTSVVLSWIDYGLNWIPLFPNLKNSSRTRWLTHIPSGWGILVDIMKMSDFYFHTMLFLYTQADEEGCISNSTVIAEICFSLALAISSNAKIRDAISPPPEDATQRSTARKTVDGLFETTRGFAQGRGLVASWENVYDSLSNTSQGSSTAGNIVRWSLAGGLSLINGYLGFIYSPHKKTEEIFIEKDYSAAVKLLYTFNNLVPPFIFTLENIYSLSEVGSPYAAILGTGFILLVPASLAHAYYKTKKESISSENNNNRDLIDRITIEEIFPEENNLTTPLIP